MMVHDHSIPSPYINAISDARFKIKLYETALQYGECTIMYPVPLCHDRLYILHWQFFICSPNASFSNVGTPASRISNIHQRTNEPDIVMHQSDMFCMNCAVVAHLHHRRHRHFSRFLQHPQSFSSNPHFWPTSIVRRGSILSHLLLGTKNGSMTGVIYFERGTKYILNSLSLPRLRAHLPWLPDGSLDHRPFASCAITSSRTRIGA